MNEWVGTAIMAFIEAEEKKKGLEDRESILDTKATLPGWFKSENVLIRMCCWRDCQSLVESRKELAFRINIYEGISVLVLQLSYQEN